MSDLKQLLDTPALRNVHPISRVDDFFYILQYLLHLATGDILFHNVSFTVILNAINRNKKDSPKFDRNNLEEVLLVYVGLKAQRELLKKSFKDIVEIESPWEELENTKKEEENYMHWMKVSREYYARIAKGELTMDDIKVGRLKDYFTGALNPLQKAEKVILEQIYRDNKREKRPCFNIDEDLYLSVPLIGFAEFDGIAHIIFEAKGKDFVTRDMIKLIIKRFQHEYEGLFLDWSSIGEFTEKRKSIRKLFAEEIKNEQYYKITNRNPILREIGCLERYLKYEEYYDFRLDEADTIPDILYLQYLRQAITAILIDSYAHNISAHSLTALSWWFRLRSQFRDKLRSAERAELTKLWGFVDKTLAYGHKLSNFAIGEMKAHLLEIRECRDEIGKKLAPETGGDGNSLITYSGHLSRELFPFFKFLMEKGAYWSGITRDANLGGKINSFFSVLWFDFVNNPLYLGTIAKTEDIRRIRVQVTVYKLAEHADPTALITKHKIELEGILAEVDLDRPRVETDVLEGNGLNHILSQRSAFVEPGDAFGSLKEKLDAIKVYFPGGVVGKHSFFTMIENEIRNVKHYHGDDLLRLQDEGLTINISLQPCNLPDSTRRELYRVGIWLKTPTILQKGNDQHLVLKKWEALYNEITEPITHSPKLGGTYQDKICAAMLLNSRFSSVQNGFKSENRDDRWDTKRDRRFFPWVTPACSPVEEDEADASQHSDFYLTVQNFMPATGKGYAIPPLFGGKGYLKKYLHLWRFEDTLDLSDGSISEMENHARFRFVHAQEKDILSLRKENGVVRIVTEPLKSERPENIYGQWLKIWNKGYPPALLLEEEGRPAALLALDTGHFKVFTADDFSRNDPDAQRLRKLAEANAASCILTIAHKADVVGKPDILRYRNHGSLRTQFWAGVDPNSNVNAFRHVAEHYPDRLPELFETLSTRICAFDNRLWQRVRKDIEDSKDKDGNIDKRLDFYRHKLKLVVHGESPTEHAGNKGWLQEWEEELITFIPDCHFLVLHLSFIERILEAKHLADPAYRAGNIGLFIDKELRPAIEQGGKIRDNFFLVVTTGRGRSEWLASLDGEDYRHFNRFTIFRPVESLISAVEHSLSIKDDIDLKFRLVKVLFGS